MKTKEYIFTEHEMYAIRDALNEYHHNTAKNAKPASPAAQKQMAAVRPLYEQFRDDIASGE